MGTLHQMSSMHKHVRRPLNCNHNDGLADQQPENDNLRGEYSQLFEDVEEDVSWARIALEQKPDAINLWIGNSRSVTALHRDNYENIYCQVIGQKHFTLISTVEMEYIAEQSLPAATYLVNVFQMISRL